MEAKRLVEENNEKRKKLTKDNLKYYEDMIVYIRLSFQKSEQETEETLSELLDHLLLAQQEGKTAQEVFGNEPKQFADNIIGELPRMVSKESVRLFSMIILYFMASSLFFGSISYLVLYYVVDIGEFAWNIHVGSASMKILLSIPIAFLLLVMIIHLLRWTCFKQINKVVELGVFWLYSVFSIGVFLLLFFFIPQFGPAVSIPAYIPLLAGAVLFGVAHFTRVKM